MRILIVSPYSKDANSFYRCMGPFSYLAKHSAGKIEIGLLDEKQQTSWDTLCQFDIIFFHRPCRETDLTLLRIAKYLQIPVWVDYDDWLFQLPSWNPTRKTYDNVGIQTIMAHMLACADLVTCTTHALFQKFSLVNTNVVIVPNAYRSDLFPYRVEEPQPRQPIIAWRGSMTHEGDLMSVALAWQLMPAKVHFLGQPGWNVLSLMTPERYQTLTDQDTFMYFKYIYNLAPKVFVFPLVDCLFNRAKSNIAYQEAIHAGSICVAPELPEWTEKLGVVTYEPGNVGAFLNAISSVFELAEPEYQEFTRDAYEGMQSLYDIKHVNQIREAVSIALINGQYAKNACDPWDQLTAMKVLAKLKSENDKSI